eukprot:1107828-Pelagomonas_calceolata.AAC.5
MQVHGLAAPGYQAGPRQHRVRHGNGTMCRGHQQQERASTLSTWVRTCESTLSTWVRTMYRGRQQQEHLSTLLMWVRTCESTLSTWVRTCESTLSTWVRTCEHNVNMVKDSVQRRHQQQEHASTLLMWVQLDGAPKRVPGDIG